MREILFRGKRTDTGEWVEGLLWKKKYNDGNRIFISCFPDKDDNEEVYVVCPETVSQFTGLHDKNGKRIFEGDIIKRFVNGKELKGFVEYTDGAFGVRFADGAGQFICFFDCGEVIGNIHDNPELLKYTEGEG